MAREEISAGAVIYSPERRRFLLLMHRDSHWEFAKGKPEGDENIDSARIREVEEETGLTDLEQVDFDYATHYEFFYRGRVEKTVVYGLLLGDGQVTISDEHRGYKWVTFKQAKRMLKFKGHREVLQQAAGALVRAGRIIPGFSA